MPTTAEKLAILDSIDAHLAGSQADSAALRAAILADGAPPPPPPPDPDTTAPVMQGPIAVTLITTTGYRVDWLAATDSVGVVGYDYRINAGAWIDTGMVRGVNIAGRDPASTDTIEVRARDVAGNIATPLSATVTLQAEAPPPTSAIVFNKLQTTGTPPNLTANQFASVNLHGGGGIVGAPSSGEKSGDWWEGACTGDYADALDQKGGLFCFAATLHGGGQGGMNVAPYEWHQRLPSPGDPVGAFQAYHWVGRTSGPGTPLELIQVRRVRELLRQIPLLYPQVHPKKVMLTGNSMGAWGAAQIVKHCQGLVSAYYGTAPRWRYADTVGNVQVMSLTASPANVDYPWGSGPTVAPIDGGGPCEAFYDVIAWAANPANWLPPMFWRTGSADQYKPFSDDIAMVAALRATKRPFAFAWNDGGHSNPPASPLASSYGYTQFQVGRGMPLFTNSSRDQVPGVDAVGGINLGFEFRNVVETATTWSCQIRSWLTGTTTVTVEPCMSQVYLGTPTPQTVTLTKDQWQTVSFA